ncbi:hypothetical protein Poli38472_014803 [Pythium oligandrum]|uniref:NAD(P)-binding domain-containing protein n=1 Tax=Pythium oligandrum TaxID=41045 RepID=A0A8K1CK65_PYTOL|nr:hypothetical protein Poli38472_014803 [Pythium oligandrum]|eukprot:TMW63893.1 hypothetical protein Poli38472_014803 [Pythium oligandrum]
MATSSAYTAVVAGSTGAVGRELVAELVKSAKCTRVIALARREIPQDQWAKSFPDLDMETAKSKLEVRAVDFEQLSTSDVTRGNEKVDAAFCCLGTTRKDAGSDEAFRRVDLDYVTRFGQASKTAQVPYFGLLTSMSASKSSCIMYLRTKGEAEDNITKLGFERTSFFRPGPLNRGESMRPVEKAALWVWPSVTTHAVVKSMVSDYESGSLGLNEWSNGAIKKQG